MNATIWEFGGKGKKEIYYRIDIKGSSTLSFAKYSASFYDKDAVDQLFGEVEFRKSGHELLTKEEVPKKLLEKLQRYKDLVSTIRIVERRDE